MPATKSASSRSPKKASRRTTTATAKRATKKARPRKMSAAHKQALSDGRAMSLTVDRYLAAVNTPKRRGRKVSKETLLERLSTARMRAKSATGIDKVLAAQAVRDLQAKVAAFDAGGAQDPKSLEAAFVRIAKKFSQNRGIGYGAWRDAGVSADVLKRAGIARTRG